jgi:formylglycine-generating enzyme required for sulfatase activity
LESEQKFVIPINDLIDFELGQTIFKNNYVNRVRLFLPVEGPPNHNFFVRFKVGQNTSVPTKSIDYGIEIIKGEYLIYQQERGTFVLQGNSNKNDSELVKQLIKERERTTEVKEKVINLRNRVNIELVWIPAGKSLIGSQEFKDNPVRSFVVNQGFWMGKYEVTQKQYEKIMKNNPSDSWYIGDNLPVNKVTWYNAKKFCNIVSKQLNIMCRLPKKDEWEYACRAGSITRFCNGDDEKDLARVAWYSGNSGNQTKKVGQKEPNRFGLFDMHGNIIEWCQDLYEGPMNFGSIERRVLKGGSRDNKALCCSSSINFFGSPSTISYFYGFRVVVEGKK